MSGYWLNIGAGGNLLPAPWRNLDLMYHGQNRIDIREPLQFGAQTCEFIFCEHCLEHVTPAQAWQFLKEAKRVLVPGGAIRIAVPSIERVFELADRNYLEWMHRAGFGEPTCMAAVENQIVNHGHAALWSHDLLICCFNAIGFATAKRSSVLNSDFPAMRGIHGHGKTIDERNNMIETIVVEAVR